MSFATILVDLSSDTGSDAAVRTAIGFAHTHGGHLIGVAATGTVDADFSWAASRSLHEAHGARDAAALLASRRADRFADLCRALHLPSFEALAIEGERAAVLLHRSQASDLTVIGQAGNDRGERQVVEHVLLHNARPTLLVPAAALSNRPGDRVLIAWDDSAACARSVGDALPVLRRAREVHLRIWQRASDTDDSARSTVHAAMQARLTEITLWLTRQGVRVHGAIEHAHQPVGDEIMRAAASLESDLIVMGTYSHSRWTERILGGATRTALQHSTVALWMGH